MNTKKFLLSALAGFIGLGVVGYLLEEIIFKTYLDTAFYQQIGVSAVSEKSVPEVSSVPFVVFLIPLSIALIMAYMYPKGYEGGTPAVEGLRFGVLLGLFSGIPFAIFFHLLFDIGFGPALAQIFIYTIEIAAVGLLIGLVYGRSSRADS
jgi:hypothetical protein